MDKNENRPSPFSATCNETSSKPPSPMSKLEFQVTMLEMIMQIEKVPNKPTPRYGGGGHTGLDGVQPKPPLMQTGEMVKRRWMAMEKLGSGTFGEVYKIRDITTGEAWAMKTEPVGDLSPDRLRLEVAVIEAMSGKSHTPLFLGCGHEPKFSYMIMELLDRSLSFRRRYVDGRKFPLQTVVRIGVQVLEAVRDLHNTGWLHRDLKPSNFAPGLGERANTIFMIDYGLARKYVDDEQKIFPPRETTNFRGTLRYASSAAHQQRELSREDDLWSIMYMLVDVAVGQLPWHGTSKEKLVGQLKAETSDTQLCANLPHVWVECFEYIRKDLGYNIVPDYGMLMEKLTSSVPPWDKNKPLEWGVMRAGIDTFDDFEV